MSRGGGLRIGLQDTDHRDGGHDGDGRHRGNAPADGERCGFFATQGVHNAAAKKGGRFGHGQLRGLFEAVDDGALLFVMTSAVGATGHMGFGAGGECVAFVEDAVNFPAL